MKISSAESEYKVGLWKFGNYLKLVDFRSGFSAKITYLVVLSSSKIHFLIFSQIQPFFDLGRGFVDKPKKFHDPEKTPGKFHDPEKFAKKIHDPEFFLQYHFSVKSVKLAIFLPE